MIHHVNNIISEVAEWIQCRNLIVTKQWRSVDILPWFSMDRIDALIKSGNMVSSFDMFLENREEIVDSMVQSATESRRSLIRKYSPSSNVQNPVDGRLGRILVARSFAECLPMDETDGFFDEDDCVPWDFWISSQNGIIYFWVPDALVDVVELGIYVCPTGVISWVDIHDVP